MVEYLEKPQFAGEQIAGVLGMARDITQRRAAEQASRDSEERFRQVVESIREVFWMSDPTKNIMLYISPSYEQIWGRTCASLYASPRSWLDSIHPDDRSRIQEAAQSKQADGSYNEEYRIVRPDGSMRWIHDRAFAIREKSGRLYRITGIAEDITDRKALEDKVHESVRALANLTIRLQTTREEERTRISRDIHDQLGQSLAFSKLYLQWMADAVAGGKFVEALPIWESRLNTVIHELDKTLAAVQEICFDLRPPELDQLGLVAAVERQAENFTRRTGIACETDLHIDDRKMHPDHATALFRVLQEALTNIVRHARATHVDIRLIEEGGRVALYVQDNGAGIQESRIEDQQSLGLLGMRERLRALNGQLQVLGVPGKGTTVGVLLPPHE